MSAGILLRAPAAGNVTIVPPPQPGGELEVYGEGDPIVRIGSRELRAPEQGFVVRWECAPGGVVAADDPIAVFSPA